ncbi:MAG: ankyrin repeat domain-containing protein [Elusimicrobia bacterium]|nr:ankyrin repeat domain-containing protein [Elusimicrobiota bacterium]
MVKRTRFIEAVKSGQKDTVVQFLEQNLDPNMKIFEYNEASAVLSSRTIYPLGIAAQKGYGEIAKALLSKGANPNARVNDGDLSRSDGTALI